MTISVRQFAARTCVAFAVIGGGVAITSGTALAHHALIAADVECVDGVPTIGFFAEAWAGWGGDDPTNDPSREHPQVDIAFNGVLVHSGAFLPSDYSFSGAAPAPAGSGPGDVVEVTATAAGWGGATTSVTIPPDGCLINGRFTGGGSQVRVGEARVTRGLTIHCDLLLSNNLEVNWGGNKFHMTEHLTTVECSDDPAIIQAPPPAPLDTLIGVGTGRFNGQAGFTIEFTLRDFGEPGRNDEMAIMIYETANPSNVALDVPLQKLSGGNLQAHYDQPHK